ncbi:MAG TPA: DUF1501 domain-containing protein, partial [Pirellulales bacterium]|nr:DUF1501 domain-containing protein [Pirellulales bacterium]
MQNNSSGRKQSRSAFRIPHSEFTTRREFLWEAGGGFVGTALAWLLARDGFFASQALGAESSAAASPLAPKPPHFAPKAKSCIFLFMYGGPSHVDLFDPKPALV